MASVARAGMHRQLENVRAAQGGKILFALHDCSQLNRFKVFSVAPSSGKVHCGCNLEEL
jgi:hypothetical protein